MTTFMICPIHERLNTDFLDPRNVLLLGSKQKQVGNTKEAIIQKLIYVHKKVIYGIVCDVEILEAFENIIKLMENLIIVQSRQ